MGKTKIKLLSKNCVNSQWPARGLNPNKESCQCSYGKCKVRVSVEANGHKPYIYVLTAQEYLSLQNNT